MNDFVIAGYLDHEGTWTFTVRLHDAQGRVYPSQAKRLAPDFAFHPQIYRADGEKLRLPTGEYTIEYARGPEYLPGMERVTVNGREARATDPNFAEWEVTLDAAGPVKLEAKAEDAAGNVEKTPAIVTAK